MDRTIRLDIFEQRLTGAKLESETITVPYQNRSQKLVDEFFRTRTVIVLLDSDKTYKESGARTIP